MSYELVIEGNFVDPLLGMREGYIGIEKGRIAYISDRPILGTRFMRLSESEIVFPGFIDSHVHFREPGWEHKADMRNESRAAALGGVTTAVDMPNNPAPYQTTTVESVLEKKRIAEARAMIDMEFLAGIGPGNICMLEELSEVVPGFKIYTCDSTGGLKLNGMEQVEEAYSQLRGLEKPVKVHCEDQEMNNRGMEKYRERFGMHGVMVHALARSAESEVKNIGEVLGVAGKYGVPTCICHVSTRDGMKLVQRDGKAWAEATIHHSLLDHEDFIRLGAMGKVNPPLRDSEDTDYIFRSVVDGSAKLIVTDHAPHALREKQAGSFWDVPSGLPSVEHYGNFAATLLTMGMEPEALAAATSYNAAEFLGLEGKGRIEEGFLADLTVLNTRKRVVVSKPYQTKCGWSPFEGMDFPGGVSCTIRRGKVIAKEGKVLV